MNIETVIRASEPELHSQDQQPGDRVGMAIDIIAAGGMVIVVDDDSRENEGDLIASAETITPQMVAFMVNHSTGILCASMSGARADALHLPPMVTRNDAAACGTGVSAADRTLSFHALAAGATDPAALRRPGHIFPLRAREGGVLTREGHTEAAFDLVRLAGHLPVGVLCELVNRDGTMMAGPQIDRFAERHGLLKVSVAELIAWRRQRGDL